MEKPIRWVGFDMDECIGSVMPLYVLVSELPRIVQKNRAKQKDTKIVYELIRLLFESELSMKTWLVRPAFFSALGNVYHAYQDKKIQGAFIMSNNGSEELVSFMSFFLNLCIWEIYDAKKERPIIFQMAVYADSPARKGYPYLKNYEIVQKCLQAEGLPLCSSPNDLLFFDDIDHPMSKEIKHYVQVPAYLNQTEIKRFLVAIQPMQDFFEEEDWNTIVQQSLLLNVRDFNRPNNTYKPFPQPTYETVRDLKVFNDGFRSFLGT